MRGDVCADPLRMTDTDVAERLDSLTGTRLLRGWSRQGGRWIVGYTEVTTDVDEPVEEPTAVMTGPQVRSFLAGVDAGMGWVMVVAREVRDAGQVTA